MCDKWAEFEEKCKKKPGNICMSQKFLVPLQPNLNNQSYGRDIRKEE